MLVNAINAVKIGESIREAKKITVFQNHNADPLNKKYSLPCRPERCQIIPLEDLGEVLKGAILTLVLED